MHFLSKQLQTLRVQLHIGAVQAFAVFAAEELVGKTFAVELETLGFFAVALQPAFFFGWTGLGGLDGDEGVALEHVLEATVAAELDGVELS
jgi:hypothetical protein